MTVGTFEMPKGSSFVHTDSILASRIGQNILHHKLTEESRRIVTTDFEAVAVQGKFDLVLTNPPYFQQDRIGG